MSRQLPDKVRTTRRRKRSPKGSPENDQVLAAPEKDAEKDAEKDSKPPGLKNAPKAPVKTHALEKSGLSREDLVALTKMDEKSLGELMEQSLGKQKRPEVGDQVTGEIRRVGRDYIFVDMGLKSEGQMARSEYPDAEQGKSITAFVTMINDDQVVLSTQLSGQAATLHLETALESGVPIEGKVVSKNPGGFEVLIGGSRAFCPISQISNQWTDDLDKFVGKTMSFRVIESGEKIVVSRKAIEAEEAAKLAATFWTKAAVGQTYQGVVKNVMPFGAFVDLGGIEGLVPTRELSWNTSTQGKSEVVVGQTLEVRILEMNRETEKLTLSAKDPNNEPWLKIKDNFVEGNIYPGTVMNHTPFGIFVELSPGIQGLVHISKLPTGLPDTLTEIQVRVVSIDVEKHRIELSPCNLSSIVSASSGSPQEDEMIQGTIIEVRRSGVRVQLEDGRSGWLAESEVELPQGTVLAQRFRRGKTITARLLGNGPNGQSVTLSMKDNSDPEQLAWQAFQQSEAENQKGGFGTLAAALGNLDLPDKK